MIISIPGYTQLIHNEVYSKPKRMPAVFGNKGGGIILSNVLLLMRYKEPTDDEVVAHLQKTIISAQEKQQVMFSSGDTYSSYLSQHNHFNHINSAANTGNVLSELEQKVLEIPPEIRKQILDEDQEVITLVRQLTLAPVPNFEPALNYLYIKSGLLTPIYITEQSLNGNLKTMKDYESAFSDPELQKKRFGERVNIRIKLSNYALIPNSDVKVLVKYGMSGPEVAPIFAVSNEFYDKDDVQEILDRVYEALPTRAHVKELTDVSKARLDELTLQPVTNLMFALNLGAESDKRDRNNSSDRIIDTSREEIVYH
ncbi:hypothetical protein HY636_01280 [Candidatus Woesearchaeota archaeon]|nr:hypothetical protein [Candidatus Woesearchaeota archaeon]